MKRRYLKSFLRDIEKLKDPQTKQHIKTQIEQIKSAEKQNEIRQLKKIKGHPYAYRIRLGNYRMGLFIEKDVVTFVRFVKRNDIYKLFA